MRKLCTNYDREDGLETVLEVPIPEEMFGCGGTKGSGAASGKRSSSKRLHYTSTWARFCRPLAPPPQPTGANGIDKHAELQILLGLAAAPFLPFPVPAPPRDGINNDSVKQDPLETSITKYIVRQYVAAVGGEEALDAIQSMYAVGKVRMAVSDLPHGGGGGGNGTSKKNGKNGVSGEMGGFVFWRKRPDLWCMELVVSGCKVSAGSDGKVSWRQTPWHPPYMPRGPPRPLRRALQGLDPRATAQLFSDAKFVREMSINGDDCFVLRLDADTPSLRARSSASVEFIRHTMWAYFSHRTGLLVHLEDSHLLRFKSAAATDSVYWETTMASTIEDYRTIDGVCIPHSGRTVATVFRFGDATGEQSSRTVMEESWEIEEVEFNIRGLEEDCFLPPGDMDLKKESDGCEVLVKGIHPAGVGVGGNAGMSTGGTTLAKLLQMHSGKMANSAKVAAVDGLMEGLDLPNFD